MHIRTKIVGKYYLSTNKLPDGIFETMAFLIKNGNVDWGGLYCQRTRSVKQAIVNHCNGIRRYTLPQKSHKNAQKRP